MGKDRKENLDFGKLHYGMGNFSFLIKQLRKK